jgi:adenylosuccinate lyase
MIERYTRPEMGAIWTLENKYRKWLEVELAVCETLAENGRIPAQDLKEIKEKADFRVERIAEIENETHHDVIAFLTSVAECVGPSARFIHLGLTSSDILDTANALLIREASDLLLLDMDNLLEVLKRRAFEWKDTLMIGRSHGIHAEPITFGLKLALWYVEMTRNRMRLERARETMKVGKLSGAVGTHANIEPAIQDAVCRRLGLESAPVSSQIIQRDRYAEFFSTVAIIGSSIEKMAVEIRHLQRTEVREAEEFFAAGQKGSSAMPHKRNPIASENLSGLARVLRGNALAAMENVALWHERDISHSSVERVIAPDSTILMDYMLNRLTGLIGNLLVYPEHMKENLNRMKGLVFSQQILLALAESGLSREDAYQLVQFHAMKVWREYVDFQSLIQNDARISAALGQEKIKEIFDVNYHLKYINDIFDRVFGS